MRRKRSLTGGDPTILPEIIPLKPAPRIIVPRRLKIATHMRLSHAVHLKIPRRKVARLERQVGVAKRLLAEVVQAMLVVCEPVVAGTVGELLVQVEETVLLVVERDRERPVVGAETRRAVVSEPPLEPPLVLRPRPTRDVMHALLHHHFYVPLQRQG